MYQSVSHIPAAAVSEAYGNFTADGTFAPQGGSTDLTVVCIAGGGGSGPVGYG